MKTETITVASNPKSVLDFSLGPLTSRRIAVIVTTIASAVILGAMLWQSVGAEARAVRDLPAAERRALYERTHDTLESCVRQNRPSRLASFCNAQATFALEFPECDAACRALAAKVRAVPAR